MKRMQKLLFPMALFLAFLLAACSPSSKNEAQYWENHKKNAEEYKTAYPGFATVIDETMKKATPMMDAAKKEGDEKKKAEKMKEANETAGKLLNRIGEVKSKSKSLEDKISKLAKLKLPKDKSQRRKDAMQAARDALTSVQTGMAEAKPTNMEEAEATLKTHIDKLISSQGAADRAYTAVAPKKKKLKKKKKKKKNKK